MSNATLETLSWVLIYGGLLIASLGLFALRGNRAFGGLLIVGGALATAAGILLIWVRSRRSS